VGMLGHRHVQEVVGVSVVLPRVPMTGVAAAARNGSPVNPLLWSAWGGGIFAVSAAQAVCEAEQRQQTVPRASLSCSSPCSSNWPVTIG
jgi:hypothetical protein